MAPPRRDAILGLVGVLVTAGACVDELERAGPRPPLPTAVDPGAADAGADGLAPGGRCRLDAPFEAPVRVAEVSDPIRNDWTFRVSPDEKTALLSRQDNEASKLFAFQRAADGTVWSGPALVDGPWAPFGGDPFVGTLDGAPTLFHSEQKEGRWSIWRTGWSSATSSVVPPDVEIFTTTTNDVTPVFVEVSAELWFLRDPGTGTFRLHRSVWSAAEGFGAPELDPVIGGSAFEANGAVVFTADGKTVYFGGRPVGGTGDIDIYRATRTSVTAPFENVTRQDEVSSPYFEQPSSLSADGCVLYLTSARGGADGGIGTSIDVWIARRGR